MGLLGPSKKERSDRANAKGQSDYTKSGGLPKANPISEMFSPTYSPPSGNEKEYKGGWDNAKKQAKKR